MLSQAPCRFSWLFSIQSSQILKQSSIRISSLPTYNSFLNNNYSIFIPNENIFRNGLINYFNISLLLLLDGLLFTKKKSGPPHTTKQYSKTSWMKRWARQSFDVRSRNLAGRRILLRRAGRGKWRSKHHGKWSIQCQDR